MANAIIKPISEEEVAKAQIEGNLPDKPSQATLYGGKVLTPQEIKAWYDRLPKLIVDYYNNLIKAIPGIEEGKISDNSLAAQILTGIREGHSLKNLLEDITSGALADYLKVTEDVNLTSFYEKVLARITTFGTEAPSEEAELGNLYAEIRDYGIRALYMYVEANGVKAWKKLWSGPKIRINETTHEWEVSYDKGESWQSLDTQAEPRSMYLSSEAGFGLPYSQYKISAVTVPSGMALKNGDIIIFANSTIAMAYNVGAETYSATVAQSFKGATGAYGYSVHYANVSTELTTTFIADTAFTNNTYNPIKAGDVCVSANGMIFVIGERYSSVGWKVTAKSSIGYSVHYSIYEATSETTEIPQSSISGALNPSIKTNDICITPNGLMFRIGTKKDEFTWNVSYLSSIQGNPFRVTKTFASVAEMEADTSIPEGSFVVISTGNVEDEENARLYVKTLTGYDFITDMSGAKGIKGDKGDRGIQGIPGISIRSCVFPYSGSNVEYAIGSIEAIANYPIKAGDLVIFNGEHLAVIQNVDASKNVFTVGQRVFYIKGDKGDKGDGVPTVTEADDGKFLRVRGGVVVAEDTRYTLNGTYAMKNEIYGLESDYYEFQERVTFGLRGRSVIYYAIRVQGMGAPDFDTEIQGCISSIDFTSESNWQRLYNVLSKKWSGGFYNLVFDDVIVSEKLYKLITENGGDAVSRELIDSVSYQVRNIDTTVKNHTTSLEKNTSDIAKHSVTLTYHDKRITNMEKGLPSERFVTDASIAYVKDVPVDILPSAGVSKIGGMCRKCTNLFDINSPSSTNSRIAISTGGAYADSGYNISPYIEVTPNQKYWISNISEQSYFAFYTKDKVFIEADGWSNMQYKTAPANAAYLKVDYAQNSTPMLNEGATALPYEPYYEGIRTAKVTAIESIGANIWDERWELGRYRESDGTPSSSTTEIRCKNYISVQPNTTYYYNFAKAVKKFANIIYYDKDKNFISALTWSQEQFGKAHTTPENCYYMRFNLSSTYGTTYLNDIMINKGETALPYVPYTKHTFELPEAVQVENGLDADCHDYIEWTEDGARVKHKRVEKIVFDGTEAWVYDQQYHSMLYELNEAGNSTAQVLSNTSIYYRYGTTAGKIIQYGSTAHPIEDYGFSSAAAWKAHLAELYSAGTPLTLVYALAEPVVTDISDLLTEDNLIEVEGGGTLTFINEHGYAVPSTIIYQVREG